MQLLWLLLQAAYTEHRCTLILVRTETGTGIPAIGEDRKAEPDARPLQALRLPGQEKMEGSIASPRLEPARQRQRLIVLEPNARRPELCRRTWLMQKRRSRTPAPRTWSLCCLEHSAVWLERFTEQGLLVKQRKNRTIYHGTCAAHFHSSCGVVVEWQMYVSHCTCGALSIALVVRCT